jgi:hypothetical protein
MRLDGECAYTFVFCRQMNSWVGGELVVVGGCQRGRKYWVVTCVSSSDDT